MAREVSHLAVGPPQLVGFLSFSPLKRMPKTTPSWAECPRGPVQQHVLLDHETPSRAQRFPQPPEHRHQVRVREVQQDPPKRQKRPETGRTQTDLRGLMEKHPLLFNGDPPISLNKLFFFAEQPAFSFCRNSVTVHMPSRTRVPGGCTQMRS